ncbi:MAG TPA: rod shape-determining protein MreC, partial [bacterium]|nr:rod shape-determining protein MreC [bacterium]
MPSNSLLRRRRVALFLVLCVVALAVLTAQLRAPDQRRLGWAGLAVEIVLAPITDAAAYVGNTLGGAWSALHEIGSLRTENARLAAEVAALRQENAGLQPAAQENDRLRALLGFKQQQPFATVAAAVIGRDPSQWFSSVLVDRGSRAGVRRNDPAV